MADLSGGGLQYLWRWQTVILAVTAVAAVALVVVTAWPEHSPQAAPGTSTSTAPANVLPSTIADAAPTPAGAGAVRLGFEVKPLSSEPCHPPKSAEGSAWERGPLRVNGRPVASAYFCNVLAGATGSLEFTLGGAYRELRVTLGFADDSPSVRHTVRFEILGDETTYLAEPKTLSFGQSLDVVADVSKTSRLRLHLVEVDQPGGNDAPSRPVWADPVLVPK
ncbi:MAG: hypothetical protein QOI20_1811 [Acidimicrobiaceae bacterium]|jgi:hypothetical protein|nr:hypothetical protein [Acidimicrobiaceae bacterium]